MCHVYTGKAYDRPISKDDVAVVKENYPEVKSSIIDDLYDAITDYHVPKPAVLVALTEIFYRAQKGDNGMYEWPVTPFSAIDLETRNRVQTPEMKIFHSALGSMALAQRNIALVNKVFNDNGRQFVMFCHCGDCAPALGVNIFESQAYKEINAFRSEMEAIGTDVIVSPSFDSPEWTERQLDMGKSEVDSYIRMWKVLCQVAGIKEELCVQTIQGMRVLEGVTS